MLKIMGKKIFTILSENIFVYLNLWKYSQLYTQILYIYMDLGTHTYGSFYIFWCVVDIKEIPSS